ncbi:hypothetical protein M436DRAFT_82703 [Aureobasidium namibiae CBS 147.97]|uniref:Protein kinase domain-containing protein n=1 Tax=Aureobasidium namibiae CBS 147.97 TaxID=1043004 RepID=A0A074WSB8_9PEZI
MSLSGNMTNSKCTSACNGASGSSAQDKKFKIVNLSGPINILLPMDEVEGVDSQLTDRVSPSPFCPYVVGTEIDLKTSDEGLPIKAQVIKCFEATLSCVMVIRFIEPPVFNNTSECILKLLDRRFSTQARGDLDLAPWTPTLEQKYQAFIREGKAEELFGYWDAAKQINREWSAYYVANHRKWSPAKWETYIQWQAHDIYEDEKKAYQLMADLQGISIPNMLGEVYLDLPAEAAVDDDNEDPDQESRSTESGNTADEPSVHSIPGLLLQYVRGFHLNELHEHLPREHWQTVVDSSLTTLRQIQDCGILNRNVNLRSFIIDPATQHVMMIDFGITKFRDDVGSDNEWERMQAWEDEDFQLAMSMQGMLWNLTGSTITYKPTEWRWRLKYRYHMGGEEEGGTEEEEEYVKKQKDFVFER